MFSALLIASIAVTAIAAGLIGFYVGQLRGRIKCCEGFDISREADEYPRVEKVPVEEGGKEGKNVVKPKRKRRRPDRERPDNVDNLKIIEGIGPVAEGVLNEAGIFTFRDLMHTPEDRLREILRGSRFAAIIGSIPSWHEQARIAWLGDPHVEKFLELEEELDFGR